MRLAADDIVVTTGFSSPVSLRPSLRAAARLEQRHGGFESIIRRIIDGEFTLMADIVAEGGAIMKADWLQAQDGLPLASVLPALADRLLQYIYTLAGIDPDKAASAQEGERMSFADYHDRLFKIATGWLGWSPDQAWNASPAEIIAAYEGRAELLAAIFGKADSTPETMPDKPDQAKLDRVGLAALKGLGRAV